MTHREEAEPVEVEVGVSDAADESVEQRFPPLPYVLAATYHYMASNDGCVVAGALDDESASAMGKLSTYSAW